MYFIIYLFIFVIFPLFTYLHIRLLISICAVHALETERLSDRLNIRRQRHRPRENCKGEDRELDRHRDRITRHCEIETKRIPLLDDVETVFMSGMAVKFMSMKNRVLERVISMCSWTVCPAVTKYSGR